MYIELWSSLGSSAKAKIFSHKKLIEIDGPTLLWILLKMYQSTAAQVIRLTMRKLDTLSDTLLAYKYNVDFFYDYDLKTLSTLADAGGDYFQVFNFVWKL